MRRTWMGNMGDIISDAANAVYGVASTVVQATPLVNTIVDGPLKDLINGPLKDFANTTVGEVFLRALASSLTGGLSNIVGPQLATMAFAVPGLLKGDDFEKAWVDEFNKRLQMLGSSGIDIGPIAQQVPQGVHTLAQHFPVNQVADWSFRGLANNANITDEAGAWALSFWNHNSLPDPSQFDPHTGAFLGLVVNTQLNSTVMRAFQKGTMITTTEADTIKKTTFRPVAVSAVSSYIKANAVVPKPVAATVKATGAPVAPKKSNDLLLVGVIGAAVVALVLWKKSHK